MKNHRTRESFMHVPMNKSPGRRLDRLPSGRVTGSSGVGPGLRLPARRLIT